MTMRRYGEEPGELHQTCLHLPYDIRIKSFIVLDAKEHAEKLGQELDLLCRYA
jgi:hypothetical protein